MRAAPLVPLVTAAEARALDADTIASGIPSRALMQRAGAAAASEIVSRHPTTLRRGVLVLAGPGNNGGDGWVIARALAAAGCDVRVTSPDGAKSPDCIAERTTALESVTELPWKKDSAYTGEGLVVDALLGTGSSGAVRGNVGAAREILTLARTRDAVIVAVDLPSGLDATTGEANGAVAADTTITFGSLKRGHSVARGLCGTVVVVDIGLIHLDAFKGQHVVDAAFARRSIPPIGAEAHKGTRKKLLLIGGAPGMAGAVILGLRAALRSGIGMVKASVHPSSVDAVHGAVPATLIDAWPDAKNTKGDEWADVLVIGPGLGREPTTKDAIIAALRRHTIPVVIDADALFAFSGDLPGLKAALGGRVALLTPHAAEMARLVGTTPESVLERRFEIGAEVARATGATVLLKGVPTTVSSLDGRSLVVPAGTPVLATGGSGDLLSGIAGTLLAQIDDPLVAAATAAWIHGRAAELAGAHTRGTTLEDVVDALPNAWRIADDPPRYPVLAELPAIADR